MLWKNRRASGNVIDRRGKGAPLGIAGLVLGAVVYALMGGNPVDYLAQNSGGLMQREEARPANDEQKKFVSVVLADTEDVWNSILQDYQEPRLILFNHSVQSACGRATSAVGPFYCPADQQVYLDLGFFKQLSQSLGAEGDFAVAYVIAHEVGHHVQNLLGIEKSFRDKQEWSGAREKNKLSVIMELQADCLAGVWAKQTDQAKKVIEEGDIAEAMNAAAAVGDDRLQKASRGQVVPDSFTHGTSAQRVEAFKLGYQNGETQSCLNSYR
ncbi:MAG TPA: neutral zinc metallopeptidase [Bacteriovoracaceae bacterium]|nr:neutral zinc metallopeptidase [Bacteriovoracaceae bacterium]